MRMLYGIKSKELANEQLFGINCPNCGTSGRLSISIIARYLHVFWIPVFSIGRTGYSSCDECHKEIQKGDMPAGLKQSYQDILNTTSVPWWHYSGLIIIGIMFIIGLFRTKVPM